MSPKIRVPNSRGEWVPLAASVARCPSRAFDSVPTHVRVPDVSLGILILLRGELKVWHIGLADEVESGPHVVVCLLDLLRKQHYFLGHLRNSLTRIPRDSDRQISHTNSDDR